MDKYVHLTGLLIKSTLKFHYTRMVESRVLRLIAGQLWLAISSVYEIMHFSKTLEKAPVVKLKKRLIDIDATKQIVLSENSQCIKYTDTYISFPLENCFILVTDIVGSTRLYNEDPCKMKQEIDMHDSIARDLAKQFNGHIVANEGDSFHVAFEHLDNAVNFAINFPEQLEENLIEFPVRIGINYGNMCVRKLFGYKCYDEPVDEVISLIKHNQGEKICIKKSLLAECEFAFLKNFCKHE